MLTQTLLIICVIFAILIPFSKQKEGLTVFNTINAYSDEHVANYDTLVYDGLKNENELRFLQPIIPTDSNVVDIGCGPGHHVHELQKRGVNTIGVDLSQAMITLAKKRYPHDFLHGSALNMSLFPQESFTHVLCMYFTIYYMKYKEQFFQNAFHWLMPGGYLIVHLSKSWDYGPTSTFKGSFSHHSHYVHNHYREIITKNNKKTRVEHKVHMESISEIIGIAKQSGFTVFSIYEYPLPYKNQYLYIFLK